VGEAWERGKPGQWPTRGRLHFVAEPPERPPAYAGAMSLLHCKGATSCFFSKHFQRRRCKSPRQKELYFAQRRRDAEFEMGFHPASLCASASLRELVLVAAEGRAAKAGIERVFLCDGIPPSTHGQTIHSTSLRTRFGHATQIIRYQAQPVPPRDLPSVARPRG
jgi:hypothetical protein